MTAMTFPVPHRGFSPARAAVSTAVAASTATAYLTACSRASQALGADGSASTTQELTLVAIGLVLGGVAGLATYLFFGQAHVEDFLYRAAAILVHSLAMLIPALACTYILRVPLSRSLPAPAAMAVALALSAVFVYAIRRCIIAARTGGAE